MPNDPRINRWTFKVWREPTVLVCTFLFALAVVLILLTPGWLAALFLFLTLVIWLVILYFFRDPDREVIDQPGLVVGPCDGTVMSIDHVKESQYLNAEVIRVSVFLSLFDVHVQRSPLSGEVTLVDHKPGRFLQAFRPEASDVNEYIAMQINTPYGDLLVKQISGILARRCINYARPGDRVDTGRRFGHIKFGSRVDLFIPPQAGLEIKVGDKVYGGLTPIAQLPVKYDE